MLVDTSVWIDHLRKRNDALVQRLEATEVWTHPYIIGELACGNLANRERFLNALKAMPSVPIANHDEAMTFMESKKLMGRGMGWIDLHLLTSAALAKMPFWTLDKRLAHIATELRMAVAVIC